MSSEFVHKISQRSPSCSQSRHEFVKVVDSQDLMLDDFLRRTEKASTAEEAASQPQQGLSVAVENHSKLSSA